MQCAYCSAKSGRIFRNKSFHILESQQLFGFQRIGRIFTGGVSMEALSNKTLPDTRVNKRSNSIIFLQSCFSGNTQLRKYVNVPGLLSASQSSSNWPALSGPVATGLKQSQSAPLRSTSVFIEPCSSDTDVFLKRGGFFIYLLQDEKKKNCPWH